MLYHLVFVVCIRQNMATGVCTQTVQSKRRDMCMSAEPSQSVSVGEAQPFIRIIIQIRGPVHNIPIVMILVLMSIHV